MGKSLWSIIVIILGVASIFFITLFQTVTNTDEHNSQLIKEAVEAAMWESVDYAYFRATGFQRIDREKFAENFIRRFADSASKSRDYVVEIVDINETPPKVSVRVSSKAYGNSAVPLNSDELVTFTLTNSQDAILENPY